MNLEPHCVILYPDQLTCPKPVVAAPASDWFGLSILVVGLSFFGIWARRKK